MSGDSAVPFTYSAVEERVDTFRTALDELRKENFLTDLMLICDGKEMFVHKIVLASSSNYFQSLLNTDPNVDIMTVTGIKSNIMSILLELIYTGTTDIDKKSSKQLYMLIAAGKQLQIDNVVENCKVAIMKKLDTTNFLPVVQLADQLNDRDFSRTIQSFLKKNIYSLGMNPLFHQLPFDKVFPILADFANRSASHDIVLRFVVAWIHFDPKVRKDCFNKFARIINLDTVSPEYCKAFLNSEPELNAKPMLTNRALKQDASLTSYKSRDDTSVKSETYILDSAGSRSHFSDKESVVPTSSETSVVGDYLEDNVPVSDKSALTILGLDEANSASIVYYFPVTDTWSELADLGMSFEYRPGIGHRGKFVYFIGGHNLAHGKMNDCFQHNLITKELRRLPDLRIPRSEMMVAVLPDNSVLAAGGKGRFTPAGLSYVEVLDHDFHKWHKAQPMNEKRNNSASWFIVENRVYVVGGGTVRCEYFDTRTKTWHNLPPLPECLRNIEVKAAAADNRVFVLKDFKPNHVFKLCRDDTEWVKISTKGISPDQVDFVTGLGDIIYVFDTHGKLYTFDSKTNGWDANITKIPKALVCIKYLQNAKVATPFTVGKPLF